MNLRGFHRYFGIEEHVYDLGVCVVCVQVSLIIQTPSQAPGYLGQRVYSIIPGFMLGTTPRVTGMLSKHRINCTTASAGSFFKNRYFHFVQPHPPSISFPKDYAPGASLTQNLPPDRLEATWLPTFPKRSDTNARDQAWLEPVRVERVALPVTRSIVWCKPCAPRSSQ